MRNKNTVIFLLIVFSAICAYNLYYTFVQFNSDSKLNGVTKAYQELVAAKPNKAQWNAADSVIQREYDALLADQDFMDTRKTAVERSFTLGLDLQGGMFVTLEVGVDDVIRQMASNPSDSSLIRALACAKEKQKTESNSFVPLFVDCMKQLEPNRKLGQMFSDEDLGISISTPDDEVATILTREAESAIDRTFNIIRTRIDQFGVTSPNLQKQGTTGRILLELPGVKEPERVRRLLRSTAKLEFYTTYSWRDAYPVLLEINTKLKALENPADSTATAADSTQSVAQADTARTDSAGTTSTDALVNSDSSETPFDQLSPEEQERKREEFRRENPLFALLQPADYNALAQAGSNTPQVGAALSKDTAAINTIFRRDDVRALVPPNMRFAWEFKAMSPESDAYGLVALVDDGGPVLDGDQVATARQDFDPLSGKPVVTMNMTPEGATDWARITGANVGKHVAIMLDNMVYSYPVVNEAIRGGSSQIAGDFTIDEAKDLGNVLKAGQLPVPARIEGEETVGPSLGAENINNGLFSFIGAVVIVMLFMWLYYDRAGLIADVALFANILFILGCSAAFTIVLTLPGIAAIVLTIGMAVDANVLIFERIREELRNEKTLKASVKAGFQHAFSSVMDSNITTFLTGLVLYIFGVGPVRGFAVALMIGIVTSLISALIITRLMLEYFANRGASNLDFGRTWTVGLFDNVKLKMSERKRSFYIVSGILTVIALASMLTLGFKTGVDFQGGRQYKVAFTNQDGSRAPLSNSDINTMRRDLTAAFSNNEPIIKTLQSDNQVLITTSYRVADRDATTQITNQMHDGLKQNFSQLKAEVLEIQDVGPTVAADIRNAALLSVAASLVMIFLYILLRFNKWQFSLGAVASLFHDVLIVLGVFSLLSVLNLPFVEVNQTFIAAILTIIGYSINDTVVVFDRIREKLREHKGIELSQAFNMAIDETISRTLVTSFTTLLSAFSLLVFGGDSIRGFVIALILGIGFGTYSSIFVASAVALDTLKGKKPAPEPAPAKA
ncbi:MAG: protein translocase subunit SecDF [Bacteroidia bacterium]|nr:protein translocase subunit SecDF [Bacteroidia bacterium]